MGKSGASTILYKLAKILDATVTLPVTRISEGKLSQCVLARPSCDSLDVLDMEVDMPDVDISERVLILSAGDYTTSYASQFGGVPISKLLLVQEHIGEWLGIC